MNCKKCNFYCYDDEYICPNCEALLEKELPGDKNERLIFIAKKVREFNNRKRVIKIIKLSNKIILRGVIPINLIFAAWFTTFRVYPYPPRTHYSLAKYSFAFAVAFYSVLLGKPAIPSNKSYVEKSKPKGLINKGNLNKNVYLIIIFFIFVITNLFYLFILRNDFLSDFIKWPSPKVEVFGINKLRAVLDIRFFIQSLVIGIFYAIHSIYNITDADYYILTRRDLHKKNK